MHLTWMLKWWWIIDKLHYKEVHSTHTNCHLHQFNFSIGLANIGSGFLTDLQKSILNPNLLKCGWRDPICKYFYFSFSFMLRGWRQSEFCWSFSICGWVVQNGWDGSFQWGYQESWIQLKWQFLPFFSSNVFPTQNGEILKLGPLAIWDSSIICNFSATAPFCLEAF